MPRKQEIDMAMVKASRSEDGAGIRAYKLVPFADWHNWIAIGEGTIAVILAVFTAPSTCFLNFPLTLLNRVIST
jgi:hypothetical protein